MAGTIVSSFLLICKLGVDIVRFKRRTRRQEETQNEQLPVWEKIKTCFKEILQLFNMETIKRVLFYLLTLDLLNVILFTLEEEHFRSLPEI